MPEEVHSDFFWLHKPEEFLVHEDEKYPLRHYFPEVLEDKYSF